MTTRLFNDSEPIVFETHRGKGKNRWFVRISSNVLPPRVYGPFLDEETAVRFKKGAEFELRKLLDGELPLRAEDNGLGQAQHG